jgi:hypothetical protein
LEIKNQINNFILINIPLAAKHNMSTTIDTTHHFNLNHFFNPEEMMIIQKLLNHTTLKEGASACSMSLSTFKRKIKEISLKCNIPNKKTALIKWLYENPLVKD